MIHEGLECMNNERMNERMKETDATEHRGQGVPGHRGHSIPATMSQDTVATVPRDTTVPTSGGAADTDTVDHVATMSRDQSPSEMLSPMVRNTDPWHRRK